MDKMIWRKAPPELIETFNAVAPGPPAEARKMFGYPACFVNGNMFAGLYQDRMILRLPEKQRDELIKIGARPFEPVPGRFMREYVTVPTAILSNRAKLALWVMKSLSYGASLPPKSKTARAKPPARAKKTR